VEAQVQNETNISVRELDKAEIFSVSGGDISLSPSQARDVSVKLSLPPASYEWVMIAWTQLRGFN
jgi:hypothetical protein